MKRGFYTRNYWKIGFGSRLYDLLTPEAYRDSLRRAAARLSAKNPGIWLDAGCGSGQLLTSLKDRFAHGLHYIGADVLLPGLAATRAKAQALGIADRVRLLRWDLSQPVPLKEGVLDGIVAHFSVYAIPGGRTAREAALRNLYHALKPGGTLVIANPADTYDARAILRESFQMEKEGRGVLPALLKKWFLYPLTHHLGLKFIERQIRKDAMHGYTLEEQKAELKTAGFTVEHSESVYAQSGWLVVAGKDAK